MSRQSAHEGGKFVRPTHRLPLPQGITPVTHFYLKLGLPQGHNAIRMINEMKKSRD